MGLLGNIGHAVSSYFDGPIPWSDRLQAAGASLGGDAQTAAAIRANAMKTIQAQQQREQQRAISARIASLIGTTPASTLDEVNAPQVGLNPAPAASSQRTLEDPDVQQALLSGAQNKLPGMDMALELFKLRQPKPKTPINTSHGVREYDPSSGNYRHLEDFPDKPSDVTPDKVLGPILAKAASGQALSLPEKRLYDRWNNGTPSKARGPSAAATGLPPGYVPR